MKIYRFDSQVGKSESGFGSTNLVISRIAQLAGETSIVCMHLGPDGRVGDHQAVSPQLFLVVQGEGWVRGDQGELLPITAGRAAFWEKGEWHAAGTGTGLVAIVIESALLDPREYMHVDWPPDKRLSDNRTI